MEIGQLFDFHWNKQPTERQYLARVRAGKLLAVFGRFVHPQLPSKGASYQPRQNLPDFYFHRHTRVRSKHPNYNEISCFRPECDLSGASWPPSAWIVLDASCIVWILDGSLLGDCACSLVARGEGTIIIWIHTTEGAKVGPLVQRGRLYASWLSRLPQKIFRLCPYSSQTVTLELEVVHFSITTKLSIQSRV